ncbi:MAG: M23 family metallopeptidase [Eubacteriales bacterium]|nr:M23 family metallopeptidase [Eubacteriales bacterium]
MLFNKGINNVTNKTKKLFNTAYNMAKRANNKTNSDDKLISICRKSVLYALALGVVTVLTYGTFSCADLRFGSEAIVNGQTVAFVNDVDEFEETLYHATQFANAISDQHLEFKVTYMPRVIHAKKITPRDEILQNIYSQCNGMVPGYALYVEGELVAAAPNKEVADDALNQLKTQYIDGTIENLTVSFDKEVDVKEEYVPAQMIMSADSIAAVLTGDMSHYGYYKVKKGDKLQKIANKLGLSEGSLQAFADRDLYTGMILPYQHKETILQVKAEYTQTASISIPYETKRISNSNLKKGLSRVETKGADGEKLVTFKTVLINGVETKKEVVNEKVITAAKDEVIQIGGGKANGKTILASAEGSTGYFLWPNRGKISSRFGIRSRDNHKGIDIAAPVGSAVYASDGGVVTFAGWNDGGYGYMVILDHGNGYVTYYAHCNKVLINEGDTVSQGQVIAEVGNTGISTGPHLHFEVRHNGTPVNPLNYMDE